MDNRVPGPWKGSGKPPQIVLDLGFPGVETRPLPVTLSAHGRPILGLRADTASAASYFRTTSTVTEASTSGWRWTRTWWTPRLRIGSSSRVRRGFNGVSAAGGGLLAGSPAS